MPKPFQFTVPGRTCSKSNSYRIVNNRLFKTKECRDWESKVLACAKTAGLPSNPFVDEIGVEIQAYFPDRRRRDLDGIMKSLFDALNGFVYIDDSQIHYIAASKHYDPENPRIEISIFDMEDK